MTSVPRYVNSTVQLFLIETILLLVLTSVCPCVSQAEARLAAKRAARAEARDIRMRELERQQKEVYNTQWT